MAERKKATVAQPTAPKATTAKRSRAKRGPAAPMPDNVRAAAAAALAVFEERLLDHADTGFSGGAFRELKGARSGMVKTVRFETNGEKHRASVMVAYR